MFHEHIKGEYPITVCQSLQNTSLHLRKVCQFGWSCWLLDPCRCPTVPLRANTFSRAMRIFGLRLSSASSLVSITRSGLSIFALLSFFSTRMADQVLAWAPCGHQRHFREVLPLRERVLVLFFFKKTDPKTSPLPQSYEVELESLAAPSDPVAEEHQSPPSHPAKQNVSVRRLCKHWSVGSAAASSMRPPRRAKEIECRAAPLDLFTSLHVLQERLSLPS